MAKEVSYEDGWWENHPWFTSNEHFDVEMPGQRNEEKIAGDDDKSLHPNMSNEILMKQPDQIIILDSENEIDDGVIKKRKGKEVDVGNEGDDLMRKKYHQPHNYESRVSVERKRRNKEAKLYDDLLALLPHLSAKTHKTTIVEEAIKSIMSLEETLKGLEKQKLERQLHGESQSPICKSPNLGDSTANQESIFDQRSNSFKTHASSNVTLTVCGVDALISICSKRIPDLFADVCYIFEKHNMEVVYSGIYSDHVKTMYMIRVRVNVPPELAAGFPYEEMYVEATTQIMHLVTLQN